MCSGREGEKKRKSDWKSREIFAQLKTITPFVVRIDGRNFKKILERHSFSKPYDERFVRAMVESARNVLEELGAVFAYLFSDEVNLYFSIPVFNLRVEKINSIVPSLMASNLTSIIRPASALSFDSRIIPIKEYEVLDYLAWRQDEAWRNHMNSYAFYTLLNETGDRREVIETLRGMKSRDIHELLYRKGINLAKTPHWQRRGIMIYREEYIKNMNGVKVKRRRIKVDWNPPLFHTEEGERLIERITSP